MTSTDEHCFLDQIDLLKNGNPLEALDRHGGAEILMFDNDQLFASGKEEARAKQEPFVNSARSIIGNIPEHSFMQDQGIGIFLNRSQFISAEGKKTQVNGIHWQKWRDGKIAEERFYRDDLAKVLISSGIMERPQDLSRM